MHVIGNAQFKTEFLPRTIWLILINNQSISNHLNAFWMNAEMLVVSHPYYTVTDEDGNFRLTNVPPGEYVIAITRPPSGISAAASRTPTRNALACEFIAVSH